MIFKLINKLEFFHKLFEDKSNINLGVLRIGTASITILMMSTIYPDLLNIYGSKSYFNHEIIFAFKPTYQPRIDWFTNVLNKSFQLNEVISLKLSFWIYLFFLTLMLFGILTRVSSAFALFFCNMFTGSGEPFIYGVDYFIMASLFYCFVFPTGNALSFFKSANVNHSKTTVFLYTFALQMHLSIVYFFNGIAKSFGDSWWTGEAIWRATMLLDTRSFNLGFLSNYTSFFRYSSWIVLSFELFFPVLICFRKTRLITVFTIIGMHIFIGVFMHLYFFAAIMIVLNVSAFWSDFSKLKGSRKLYRVGETIQNFQL